MLLIAKLLSLMQHVASSTEVVTVSDVLWQVLLELQTQLMMRKPHMCACPCWEGGTWYHHGIVTHMSELLTQHLLCLLRTALKAKQDNAGLCCSILAGLMYSGIETHVWSSVASIVRTSGQICCNHCGQVTCGIACVYKRFVTKCWSLVLEHTKLHVASHVLHCESCDFPGGLAALAMALDGDRPQAECALDAMRYCLDPKSATSPDQVDDALVVLARMQGVLRCSALLCPPVGDQDQGNWVETGRPPL